MEGADQKIIDLIRAGRRPAAYAALVEAHGRTVYNVALFTLQDAGAAEDATQDAFLRIFRNLGKFRGDAKLSSWLYRIVRNVCYDQLRRNKLGETAELPDELPDHNAHGPEARFAINEQAARVQQAVAGLPGRLRLAVTLHYFQHMKYVEIAEVLEQPLGTIKSDLHRAKTLLRKRLAQEELVT